ncbi:hypothetical protein [Methanobrevibacter filiformis]|nr:hypothetical protein [Methanobrevibacter filiformis]
MLIIIIGLSSFLLSNSNYFDRTSNLKGINVDVNVAEITNNSSNRSNYHIITVGNTTDELDKFTNFEGKIDDNGIKVTLNTEKLSSEGKTIDLIVKINNTGNYSIDNIILTWQYTNKSVGSINPGEVKTFNTTTRIPTTNEFRADFGPEANVSNPYFIGSFEAKYLLNKGIFIAASNSVEIPLR